MKRRIANKIAKQFAIDTYRGKLLRYTKKQIEDARRNASLRFLPFFPQVPPTLWSKWINLAFSCIKEEVVADGVPATLIG